MTTVALLILTRPGQAFAQNETISPEPSDGPFGATVAVTGAGWDLASGTVSIYLGMPADFTSATPLTTATPNAGGSISTSFRVGDSLAGDYVLFACQNCGSSIDGPYPNASAAFTVDPPSFEVGNGSGVAGETYAATGRGWNLAYGPVSIFPSSDAVGSQLPLAEITPGTDGAFSEDVTLPTGISEGAYDLFACQKCGDPDNPPHASTPFVVSARGITSGSTTGTTPPTTPSTTGATPPTGGSTTGASGITPSPAAAKSGTSPGLLILVAFFILVVVAGGIFAARRPTARRRRPEWERHAESERRETHCDGKDRWYCHRGDPDLHPSTREISEGKILPATSGAHPYALGPDTVEGLTVAMRALARRADASGELRAAARRLRTEIGRAAGGGQELGRTALELEVQGGKASLPYTLNRCERDPDGQRSWVKHAEWTGEIEDRARYSFAFQGPSLTEPLTNEDRTVAIAATLRVALRTILEDSVFHRAQLTVELSIEAPE